jgi:glycosyltransferase involved in cell wall biosynthesis
VPTTYGGLSSSVVICTYAPARSAQLARLVESLRSQTVPPDQIIVVVDHNAELLPELRARLPGVLVTANVHEQGLSGGRNTGIECATGDVVAFIDDDATAEPDWLQRLLDAYEDPAVIGAGGQVEPMWEVGVPAWFPAEFGWVVGCGYPGLAEGGDQVRNLIGCSMSFRRRDIAGAGGFRIDLGRVGLAPVGCEETEFCIRLTRENPGRRLRFESAARVRHFVPRNRATWAYFRSRCYSEGRSKARVARIAGAGSALASERSYVARTLTRAVAANAIRLLHGDWPAAVRGAAILAGLATTTAGYLVGRWELAIGRERLAAARPEPAHQS